MRSDTALAWLIASELALVIVGFALPLADSPEGSYELDSGPGGGALPTVLWAGVALATLLGWIGLLYRVREARTLYLASWLGYLGLELLRGPAGRVDAALGMLTALVGGAILALVYLSDLRDRFRPLLAGRRPGAR